MTMRGATPPRIGDALSRQAQMVSRAQQLVAVARPPPAVAVASAPPSWPGGCRPTTSKDVVQETALRLYRSWSAVDPGRPLLPDAVTIAMNHWRDTLLRDPCREVPGDVPERADVDDVERTALARLEVSRVSRALRQLRPRDRDILLGADVPVDGPVPAARRMMLMRARRELMAILETASSWVAAGSLGLGALRAFALGRATPAAVPPSRRPVSSQPVWSRLPSPRPTRARCPCGPFRRPPPLPDQPRYAPSAITRPGRSSRHRPSPRSLPASPSPTAPGPRVCRRVANVDPQDRTGGARWLPPGRSPWGCSMARLSPP